MTTVIISILYSVYLTQIAFQEITGRLPYDHECIVIKQHTLSVTCVNLLPQQLICTYSYERINYNLVDKSMILYLPTYK